MTVIIWMLMETASITTSAQMTLTTVMAPTQNAPTSAQLLTLRDTNANASLDSKWTPILTAKTWTSALALTTTASDLTTAVVPILMDHISVNALPDFPALMTLATPSVMMIMSVTMKTSAQDVIKMFV
jgi:hypothetical protein